MRLYLVDGSNAVRRADFDPRFPHMDELRHGSFLDSLCSAAASYEGAIEIEVFFDGPRRSVAPVRPPVRLRFPIDGEADGAILGTARQRIAAGRGVVVVTEDSSLANGIKSEGGTVIRLGAFFERLRSGRA